jgi:hypothetical protein
MRLCMWIPMTAAAGETPLSVFQGTRVFVRQWLHKGGGELRCSPGSAARNYTWTKSFVFESRGDDSHQAPDPSSNGSARSTGSNQVRLLRSIIAGSTLHKMRTQRAISPASGRAQMP